MTHAETVQAVYNEYYQFICARVRYQQNEAPDSARGDMMAHRANIIGLLLTWLKDSPDVYDLLDMMAMDSAIPGMEEQS